ncbi:hypothetical protein, partial [Thermoleptolyngbya sp. M55_K2018_002]|uniref:hypothetical protein n=1 Tax=Thermoleptolyngbya sp. M55_K2018_002 TaxID=2747808 RepID=UPI001A051074
MNSSPLTHKLSRRSLLLGSAALGAAYSVSRGAIAQPAAAVDTQRRSLQGVRDRGLRCPHSCSPSAPNR